MSRILLALSITSIASTLTVAPTADADEQVVRRQLDRSRLQFSTPEAWERRRQTLRREFLKGAQLWPLPSRPPVPTIVGERRVHKGYSVTNVALETLPGFYCTGNLYEPIGRKDLGPAVLCPHGHFRPLGRYRADQQIRCAHLARMGATVFSYSLVGWQDSTQTGHDDPLVLALQTWNSLCVVDYLASLPRVDASRIGVTGASGGGTQAFFLTLIDDRITASAPLVIVYPWSAPQGCLCEGGLPVMQAANTNAIELAAAAAPRPQLLISVGNDPTRNFPRFGFPFVQHMYRVAGAGDRVANVHFAAEQHDFGPSKRRAVYEFFAEHLRLTPNRFKPPTFNSVGTAEDLSAIKIESPEDLRVFDKDHPRPAGAVTGSSAVGRAFREHLATLRKRQSAAEERQNIDNGDTQESIPTYSFKAAGPADERLIFTPPGFNAVGEPKVASRAAAAALRIRVHDGSTGRPTHCRINVVGADGNFYQPRDNPLREHSLTGVWPRTGWGNRPGKAPVRYLGRFFYCDGNAEVMVPAGAVRVEVWKGFEYRPTTYSTAVARGESRTVTIRLDKTVPMESEGYWSGDAHIHIQRRGPQDDDRILALMAAEDIHYAALLAYNEPAGPYTGLMDRMESAQLGGTGSRSTLRRGTYTIQSGQEYRSSTYGHINVYMLDQLVLPGESVNANNWPPFGHIGARARELGGVAFYAHGGYAKEIYADVVQGNVDGVELLQFGVYRGIGLTDWYHMLNAGFRVPAMGACDYPACRKLGDCKTYVLCGDATAPSTTEAASTPPKFEAWMRGMADGRSFFTNGPLLLLEVDGRPPGGVIHANGEQHSAKVRLRVRSEVAPITHVQLIANGRVVKKLAVPPRAGQGQWVELACELHLERSAWIAARAFSVSALGTPDAEAHTNPVYVYFDNKAPYERRSLDQLVGAIDGQIEIHKQRQFDDQARVIAYFEKSRDILLHIRERGGASANEHPAKSATAQSIIDNPGKRTHSPEELRKFLRPLPPKPIADVLRSFDTRDGFSMELVAQEPLVHDPTAACFDEDGNLYVCEMRDYPFKPADGGTPRGSVRMLRDKDDDGIFDESHLFAEGLLWACGVAPWKGGVFVAAAPDIWYLKDTDGDFRADIKRRVYRGFGTANQQAMLNNLTWGLDHQIYGSTAGNGGLIRHADPRLADTVPVPVDGRDFRFSPATGRFESISGTVQFGTTFDDWGNRFLCSESRPLLHAVLPQRYLARNPFLPVGNVLHNVAPGPVPVFRISPLERWRMIRSSRRIAHGARSANSAGASHHVVDAAAGVTVYRGDAYPREYYGNVFVGGPQNNLIHRRLLRTDGVTFKSERADERSEFVRSSDNWFRPVNFVHAPDGTLYVLDMSREVLETIHVPLDVAEHLDFTSGRNHGRIYRVAYRGRSRRPTPNLGSWTTQRLIETLAHPNVWHRETAHRLLFERQDRSAVPLLQQLVVTSPSPQARLLGLYSLAGLRALDDRILASALQDKHPRVREHALQLSESHLQASPALLQLAVEQLKSPDARLRLQAVFSMGEARSQQAAAELAELLRTEQPDRWIDTALLSSLGSNPMEMVRRLAADAPFAKGQRAAKVLPMLATVVGARGEQTEVHNLLTVIASNADLERTGLADRMLAALGKAGLSNGRQLVAADQLPDEAAEFVATRLARAETLARQTQTPAAARESAIGLLACAPYTQTHEVLTRLFDPGQPDRIQLAALRALSGYENPTVGLVLTQNLNRRSPDARAAIVESLLARTERLPFLLSAIEKGDLAATAIDPARRDALAKHASKDIREKAGRLFRALVTEDRADALTAYRTVLSLPGDRQNGQRVFTRECAVCHRLGNTGRDVGPNLGSSAARDPAALLSHILDPNRYVLPRYETHVLIETNGRTSSGLLGSQSANSVTLIDATGRARVVLRANIDTLRGTGRSLMPEGFEQKIDRQQMADLLQFLVESQQTAKSALPIGTLPGLIEPTDGR